MKSLPFASAGASIFSASGKIFVWCSILFLGVCCTMSCHNATTPAVEDNPVFQSDPSLKGITDQIKKSPGDADLYFRRGTLLHRMHLDTLAVKDYKTASSLDTNKAEYYSAVGDLLFESKDLTDAISWIQKAIRKDPDDPKARLKLAKFSLYLGQYAKAFDEINVVMRRDPHNPEGDYLKGMVYKEMKDTAQAISKFETAVMDDPEYRDAILQLGLLHSARKEPIALSYFDRAFNIDSTDVFPIFAKGVYYQNMNDIPAAKAEYTKCILRNRHYPDAYFNMGFLLMQEDSVQKAWRQYDIVTKIDPRNPTAYYDRGVCSEQMDSINNAVDDYRIAVALDTSYKSPREALRRLKKE